MRYLIVILLLFSNSQLFAEEGHDHGKESENHGAESEKEHGGHSEHEETSSNVGPEKGITEKNEKDGLKLSPEAIKTMALETAQVSSLPMKVPNQAIVRIKAEKFIFRLRDGWFKRVEVEITQKVADDVIIKSSEVVAGDKLVIGGLGFLRTAEIYS